VGGSAGRNAELVIVLRLLAQLANLGGSWTRRAVGFIEATRDN
jgi:hypothetical protein